MPIQSPYKALRNAFGKIRPRAGKTLRGETHPSLSQIMKRSLLFFIDKAQEEMSGRTRESFLHKGVSGLLRGLAQNLPHDVTLLSRDQVQDLVIAQMLKQGAPLPRRSMRQAIDLTVFIQQEVVNGTMRPGREGKI